MGIIAIRHGQSQISYQVREEGISTKPSNWKEIKELSEIRNKNTENSGLSIKGIAQINEVSSKLKNYKIDKIYISPMKRVKESYKILKEKCNLLECKEDQRINAIISGVLHGHLDEKSEEYVKKLPYEAINDKQFSYNYQTGESQFRAVQRVYNFLDDIKKEWEEKNVLLITHKSTLRIINTYFNELLNNEIYEFNPKNSEVFLYGKIFE